MTGFGLVLVLAIVLRWVGRVLLRAAEWIDPGYWDGGLDDVDEPDPDPVVVPFYGRRRA